MDTDRNLRLKAFFRASLEKDNLSLSTPRHNDDDLEVVPARNGEEEEEVCIFDHFLACCKKYGKEIEVNKLTASIRPARNHLRCS